MLQRKYPCPLICGTDMRRRRAENGPPSMEFTGCGTAPVPGTAAFLKEESMDANTCGWIAAYLEWTDADACAIEPAGSEIISDFEALDCAQTAAAYLEWMTTTCFGRRAGDRAPRALETIPELRGTVLMQALQTEADVLQLVAGDVRSLAAKVLALQLH
jgi:hypothetical protein